MNFRCSTHIRHMGQGASDFPLDKQFANEDWIQLAPDCASLKSPWLVKSRWFLSESACWARFGDSAVESALMLKALCDRLARVAEASDVGHSLVIQHGKVFSFNPSFDWCLCHLVSSHIVSSNKNSAHFRLGNKSIPFRLCWDQRQGTDHQGLGYLDHLRSKRIEIVLACLIQQTPFTSTLHQCRLLHWYPQTGRLIVIKEFVLLAVTW